MGVSGKVSLAHVDQNLSRGQQLEVRGSNTIAGRASSAVCSLSVFGRPVLSVGAAQLKNTPYSKPFETKQSSVRLAAADNLSRSPTESQASSDGSWRQALSSDGRVVPGGMVGKHDHGNDGAAIEEGERFHGASETVEVSRDEEEAVENMNVADLKAKAAEVWFGVFFRIVCLFFVMHACG